MIDYTRNASRPGGSSAPPGYVAPPPSPSPSSDPAAARDDASCHPTQDAERRPAPWLDPDLSPGDALSYGTLLSLTMALVAGALGVMVFGSVVGADLEPGTARVMSFVGFGMLIAQSFVGALRTGTIGVAWLGGIALAVGLGLGPAMEYFVTVEPDLLAQAVGMTGVTVLGAACLGTCTSKDLVAWMRPVSLVVFVFAISTWFIASSGSSVSPVISGVIGIGSAVLIVVYFNYLQRRAEKDDIVWLATGIFVAIVNIFLSFLNILDD